MDSILVGKYEGEYQNGLYHGKGKITYGKNSYEGTFFNGQMHGEGKMTCEGKMCERSYSLAVNSNLICSTIQRAYTRVIGWKESW